MNFKFIRDKQKCALCTNPKNIKSKLKDIYELEIAKFMHSFHNNLLPEKFENYFQTASNRHDLTFQFKCLSITTSKYLTVSAGEISCIPISYFYVKVFQWSRITFRSI